MTDDLAILGGTPVRSALWPTWPRSDERTLDVVADVLRSTRWALSGPSDGRVAYEQRFAEAFAMFNEMAYCTPVSSGTAALTIALQALGVGWGDEVVVPGLTWVACASAVVNLGAHPVLVDIDPATLTVDPQLARQAVTDRTRAIMVVHFANSVADLDAFVRLSEEMGIPLVEDCAQAHGAIWRGRRVGSYGRVGCFSMQQSKLLTAGEGGAAITDDETLYDRLEQLRSDGRRLYPAEQAGQLELVEAGEAFGRNLCLSELQAAVLWDRLKHLDAENEHRRRRAAELTALLDKIPGVDLLVPDSRITAPTYYNTLVRLDPLEYAGNSVDLLARALSAELADAGVHPVYVPLNRHRLLCPEKMNRGDRTDAEVEQLRMGRFELPAAEEARRTYVTLPHRVLLDTQTGMEQIALAFTKVRAQAHKLVSLDQGTTARAF
ncbi:DegT/DnrJ/EryC1/StrS family aminotransferase [Streptomyces sp. 7N604]|uniref:DegT/DnrJ/EryC1/StrS family aminotransferase n=1 Tax=Streptomyces sp. 7N604 TaxID=3457415 RepID=UPI003FD5C6B6